MSSLYQIRLLVGGPANSGKSTLCTSLYRVLQTRPDITVGLHEIDVYSDTHSPLLGIKPWSERQKQWGAGLPEVEAVKARFMHAPEQIVIGDLPGNIHNEYLLRMMAGGTHAMYVGRSFDEFHQWEAAFVQLGIPVEWIIRTRLNGHKCDPWPKNTHTLHDLDRKILVDSPEIQALANEVQSLWQRTARQQA